MFQSYPTITYNLICLNSASEGAGILCAAGDYIIENNTIYSNSATTSGGGILLKVQANVQIDHTIIWGNVPNEIDSGFSNDDLSIAYSDIQGGWEGLGNIDCDPLFCNLDEGNYYLIDTSCCIGSGEEGQNIGAYGIGCYAVDYLIGDVNMAYGQWPPVVVEADITYLLNYFRSASSSCLLGGFYCSADINGDCIIIGSDLTRLVNCFRGLYDISYCPDYRTGWLSPDEVPDETPDGWPGCE